MNADSFTEISFQQIIRGVKVPCSWQHSVRKNDPLVTGKHKSNFFRDLESQGIFPKNVRIRRDGLLTLGTKDSMAELVISPDIVKELENNILKSGAYSEPRSNDFKNIKIDYYGIPLSDPKLLFSALSLFNGILLHVAT